MKIVVEIIKCLKIFFLFWSDFFYGLASLCENWSNPFTLKKKMKIFEELFNEQIAIISQFYKSQYYGLENFYKEIYPLRLYKEERMNADIYATKMTSSFVAQKERVIKKAMDMSIREIFIPFLPVLYFDKKIDGADIYQAQYVFNFSPERKMSENFLIPAEKLLKKRSIEKWSGYWKYYWPKHSQSNANTK